MTFLDSIEGAKKGAAISFSSHTNKGGKEDIAPKAAPSLDEGRAVGVCLTLM